VQEHVLGVVAQEILASRLGISVQLGKVIRIIVIIVVVAKTAELTFMFRITIQKVNTRCSTIPLLARFSWNR